MNDDVINIKVIIIIQEEERVVQRLEYIIDNGAMVSSILPMLKG